MIQWPDKYPHAASSSLWLNWKALQRAKTPQSRYYYLEMIAWIRDNHPESVVRETAEGMLNVWARKAA